MVFFFSSQIIIFIIIIIVVVVVVKWLCTICEKTSQPTKFCHPILPFIVCDVPLAFAVRLSFVVFTNIPLLCFCGRILLFFLIDIRFRKSRSNDCFSVHQNRQKGDVIQSCCYLVSNAISEKDI